MGTTTLRGALTALVTPFDDAGRLDVATLRRLLERQLDAGIHGLVPCGTTGETPTLSMEEWEQVIGVAVEAAGGRVPVVAGTGTNDTTSSIRRTRRAAELGADAALVVVPYYNKPNRSGLRRHFESVAGEGGLPVVLYNVPGRTGTHLDAETILELGRIPGVIGVKEASGNVEQVARILAGRPDTLAVLSGEDALTLPMMALGAEGVIAVVGNEDPRRLSALCEAAARDDLPAARRLHGELLPLMLANFLESNPVPVKEALGLMGLIRPVLRAPLGPASEETRRRLQACLDGLGLREPAR